MEINFTLHSEERMKKRNITEEEVTEAIKNPDKIIEKNRKRYSQKSIRSGIIEVVYEKLEKNIKVITVYWL